MSLLRPVMPELDTVRGLAVLAVIFLHGFFWAYSSRFTFSGIGHWLMLLSSPGGFGVNLFFVLSGFLITGILMDSRTRPHYYSGFYIRRALRILPAYYTLLLVLKLLGQAGNAYLGLAFIYLANVVDLFGVGQAYGPLWSLAVEEHYYLLWPAAVRRLSTRSLALFSAALCLLIPLLRAIAFWTGHTRGLTAYTWLIADGLAMGSLLAIVLRQPLSRSQIARIGAAGFAGGVAVLIAGFPFRIYTRTSALGAAFQPTIAHVFCASFLLLTLLLGTGRNAALVQAVNWRPLRFLGYISYGLYLWHWLAYRLYDSFVGARWPQLMPRNERIDLVILRFLLAMGAAVLVTYLSRRYYEEWFLQWKSRFAPKVEPLPQAEALPQAS